LIDSLKLNLDRALQPILLARMSAPAPITTPLESVEATFRLNHPDLAADNQMGQKASMPEQIKARGGAGSISGTVGTTKLGI
jgi:hypothetical protein